MDFYRLASPLYWKLNPSFSGDRILSYGGYIRFTTITENAVYLYPDFHKFPIVRLQGNGLELFYYPPLPPASDRHEVRFHESLWKNSKTNGIVSREMLMIVLQNVKNIYVKASNFANFEKLM